MLELRRSDGCEARERLYSPLPFELTKFAFTGSLTTNHNDDSNDTADDQDEDQRSHHASLSRLDDRPNLDHGR